MDRFFQKFIVVGIVVNFLATIFIFNFSTARAEVPVPSEFLTDPLEANRAQCTSWVNSLDLSGLSSTDVVTYRARWFQYCLRDPDGAISAFKKEYDRNVLLRQGKHDLPTGTPYAPNFPQIPGTEGIKPTEGIPQLVAFIYLVGLWLVGAVVFVQITLGGVRWLLAAGRPGEIEKAKTQITNAILGLILLISSYVILSTINPDLVNSVFDPPLIGKGNLPR